MSDNKNPILNSSNNKINNQNQEIDTTSKLNGEKKVDVIEDDNGKEMVVPHIESKELVPSYGTKSNGETLETLLDSIGTSVEMKENEF